MSLPVWSRISESVAAAGRAALVTIVSTRGSVPREAGTRMVVRPDGSFSGTIGGGALEYHIIADARQALASEAPCWSLREHPLGPELGQCCGGQVSVLIEVFAAQDHDQLSAFVALEAAGGFRTEAVMREGAHLPRESTGSDVELSALSIFREGNRIREQFHDPRKAVLLFGAGHVGRALVMALAALPFRIRWIDPRADAFPALLPANVTPILTAAPDIEIEAAPRGSFVLVMTHSHALDLAIISAALKRGGFDYVGLIGSATKRARFIKRMRAAEISDAQIAHLICPIGVPGIHGKEPAMIAASVTAQLLQTLEQHVTTAAAPLAAHGRKRLTLVGRE